jgi:ribonuclease T
MNTATDGAPAPPPAAAALMARRFRGYLPVVIDVECGGFNAATDALLEIAAVLIEVDADGTLRRGATHDYHVQPFAGARLDPKALSVTGIDPHHPLRPAIPERDALQRIFREVRHAQRAHGCRRAILVGHNAAFDLAFLNAAVARTAVKRNPFHPFSCFDTATLAGAALGQTVLGKALTVAGLEWDAASAHSARYDAERSAELFCLVCNRLRDSYREARERAEALGWLNAPADEPAGEDTPLEDAIISPPPPP